MKKIEMLKQCMLLLAITLGLAACSNEDNAAMPVEMKKSDIVGRWYGDVTGTTFALWNYGRVWQETEFKADGTGTATVYYLLGNAVPVACERYGITYQIGDDGRLTYSGNDRPYQLSAMLRADGRLDAAINDKQVELRQVDQAMDANFSEWRGEELIDVPAPARSRCCGPTAWMLSSMPPSVWPHACKHSIPPSAKPSTAPPTRCTVIWRMEYPWSIL